MMETLVLIIALQGHVHGDAKYCDALADTLMTALAEEIVQCKDDAQIGKRDFINETKKLVEMCKK